MMETQFQSIWSDIISGLITGVTLALFFFLVERIFYWNKHRKDVSRIRNIFLDARKDIMEYQSTYNESPNSVRDINFHLACRYNAMIKELDGLLSTANLHISVTKKKDILKALDWYRAYELKEIQERTASSTSSEIPDGMMPASYINIEIANEIFGKLGSIKWLKMKPIAS